MPKLSPEAIARCATALRAIQQRQILEAAAAKSAPEEGVCRPLPSSGRTAKDAA